MFVDVAVNLFRQKAFSAVHVRKPQQLANIFTEMQKCSAAD